MSEAIWGWGPVAPIEEKVVWLGQLRRVLLQIPDGKAEKAILKEKAAAGDFEELQAYQETLSRMARAVIAVDDGNGGPLQPVPFETDEGRLAWVDGWPDELVTEVSFALGRAKGRVTQERQKLDADPNSAAGPEPSGGDSGEPAPSTGAS